MRHRVAGHKLGRNTSQRSALLRGLITELFRHDRISTTEAKAHFMRSDAEHLITVAKRGLAEGGNNVHAHRMAARVITDPDVTKRLFNEIAPRFVERAGGYTRMVKIGPRLGDGAEMVVLELVEKGSSGDDKDAKAKTEKARPAKAAGAKESKAKEPRAKGGKADDVKAKGSKPQTPTGKESRPKGGERGQ